MRKFDLISDSPFDQLLNCARFGNAGDMGDALKEVPVPTLDASLDGVHTMLGEAASFGNLETVKLLVEKGASVDCRVLERSGDPPVKKALENAHVDVFAFLISHGADLYVPGWMGITTADRLKEMVLNWDVTASELKVIEDSIASEAPSPLL